MKNRTYTNEELKDDVLRHFKDSHQTAWRRSLQNGAVDPQSVRLIPLEVVKNATIVFRDVSFD